MSEEKADSEFIRFYEPKQFIWKPRPDITAYELALAIPIITFHCFERETAIGELPEEVQRHFEEVKAEATP